VTCGLADLPPPAANPKNQRGHCGPRDCNSSKREREAREEGEEGEEEEREREARREARQRERERKRLILLQQQLQQQQQLVSEEGEGPSSDAEDEVLFREGHQPAVGDKTAIKEDSLRCGSPK
ncbi:hypothetical protein O3P69_010973, partial [Scylla paramamosain]